MWSRCCRSYPTQHGGNIHLILVRLLHLHALALICSFCIIVIIFHSYNSKKKVQSVLHCLLQFCCGRILQWRAIGKAGVKTSSHVRVRKYDNISDGLQMPSMWCGPFWYHSVHNQVINYSITHSLNHLCSIIGLLRKLLQFNIIS